LRNRKKIIIVEDFFKSSFGDFMYDYEFKKTESTRCSYFTNFTCQTCKPIENIGMVPEKLGIFDIISRWLVDIQLRKI
jgi:hypothetical protein